MFCVRKKNEGDVSLTHPKPIFDLKRTVNYQFWGYILLCLSPYNSNTDNSNESIYSP